MLLTHLVPWRGPKCELEVPNDYRNPFDVLSHRMNGLLEDFGIEPFSNLGMRAGTIAPAVDVSENETEIVVTAELPGIAENDIELSLTKDSLTLKGEKKQESQHKAKNYQRLERHYGSFERTIPLPCQVDRDKVEAEFKNGVLTVKLPKTEEAINPSKRIEVKTG